MRGDREVDYLTREDLPALFAQVAAVMTEQAEFLSEMDARMGDGDLGITMGKGFSVLPEILRESEERDFGKTFVKAGMKMASVVPSTMGTLMASGIMSGGKKTAGKEKLDAPGYLLFLQGFAEGIAKRGKCVRGERTVLDAVGEAADCLETALAGSGELSLAQAAEIAACGAMEGVEKTKSMEPKYGKAAVHKAAALGTPDQGAYAGYFMLKGMADFLKQ